MSHELLLLSADKPLCFSARIAVEVSWRGNQSAPPSLLDIAWAGITQRAEEVSKQHTLTAHERLKNELNLALLPWHPVTGTAVHARGHCASLEADAELVAAVTAREEAARRHLILSWQDEQQARRAEEMRSLILNPLKATAWWLLENQDKPDQSVRMAKTFQELREILAPERRSDSAGQLVDELLTTEDETIVNRFVHLLERVFMEYDRKDLALRLRTREENETDDH